MRIFNIEEISALDAKTVVTVGMFDGVHAGHRHLLSSLAQTARERLQSPIVVTFDRHPRLVMNSDARLRLLSTYDERMRMLEECGVTDVAIVHFTVQTASLSACQFVQQFLLPKLGMKTLLLGYDNMFGSHSSNDFDLLPQLAKEYGFDICRDNAMWIDGVAVSSTKIRQALSLGNIDVANAMLGSPYTLSGTVVHGRHVGTTLGFPTANIMPDDSHKMLPAPGVYALRATVGGRVYKAIANLGSQPTFHNDRQVLEAHLLDFDGDIYGREIEVEFIERLRDIREFANAEELRFQIEQDKQSAIHAVFELSRDEKTTVSKK